MDEPQHQAENTVAEDSIQETSPVAEPTTSDSPVTEGSAEEAQVTEPAADENNSDEERKPNRAERRIRQLSEEVKQLREQPNQFAPNFDQSPVEVQPGQEITDEQYQQHLAQAAQSVVTPQLESLRAELETKEAKRNFDADEKQILSQYDELKDGSPIKDVIERQISEEFQQKAFRLVGIDPISGQPQYRLDPSVRLADIAATKVADARAIAEKASADRQIAIETTADEAGLKPSGSATSDRKFEDLSIEEMEQKLGYVSQ